MTSLRPCWDVGRLLSFVPSVSRYLLGDWTIS
ncbi:hypothetical protein [Brochothrix phage ADU4]|nr:hypothetical protein [Brochothrix phage ADU4]